jgi:hypothetical protein
MTRSFRWSLLSLGLLTGCMCGPSARPCASTAECGPGQVCVGGQCRGGSSAGGAAGGGSVGGGDAVGGGSAGSGGGDFGGGTAGGDPFAEDSGVFDAGVVPYDGGCGPIMAGNPPYPRECAPGTTNECGGAADTFLSSRGVTGPRLNGNQGNGFDDDCDGLVDEGCSCPAGGTTKDCYLVPATQVNPATNQPVGWCTANARGSLDCAGTELTQWSGVCRGAQRPQVYDSCAPGDFDCDGLSGNNQVAGCNCATEVECPTAPLVLAPYPSPTALPRIDGTAWIKDAAQRPMAQGWTWTVLGGDCDNVLPHPTFALYSQTNATAAGARIGSRTPVRFDMASMPNRYVPAAGQPLIALQAARGNAPGAGVVFPAFGLSGDYLVQGEFTLNGQRYVCTQRVEVRAPGIRAELCWDTVGRSVGGGGNDIDLHVARLQGTNCGANQGWNDLCATPAGGILTPPILQDCYWDRASGCRAESSQAPRWGYPDSASTACQGWSSKRAAGPRGCTNPRLDRDNIQCDRSITDPTAIGDEISGAGAFCGPENINLDNPNNGDTFVIGVNHFQNAGGPSEARPHVNVYCNGRRVLSIGYNPATMQQWPVLRTEGADSNGDHWTAALVRANVTQGNLTSCDVTPIPSRNADPTRDGPPGPMGGNGLCVDSRMNATPAPNQFSFTSKRFLERVPVQGPTVGGVPAMATQWCKH